MIDHEPIIEAIPTGDGAFVAYCRCTWWNGPFLSAAKAVAWGEKTHRECDVSLVMAPDDAQAKASSSAGDERV